VRGKTLTIIKEKKKLPFRADKSKTARQNVALRNSSLKLKLSVPLRSEKRNEISARGQLR
jgi:hypothetical protein